MTDEDIEEEFEDWSEGPFVTAFKKDPHMVEKKKLYFEDDLERIDGVPYMVLTNLKPGAWVQDFQNGDIFPLEEIEINSGNCSGGAINIRNGRLVP